MNLNRKLNLTIAEQSQRTIGAHNLFYYRKYRRLCIQAEANSLEYSSIKAMRDFYREQYESRQPYPTSYPV